MTRRRSLSFRLVGYLFVIQMFLIIMMPIFAIVVAVSGLNPTASQNLNEWGEGYAQDLIARLLQRGSGDSLRVERGSALSDYLRDSPSFLYAAWDAESGIVAEGSSKVLVDAIRPKWNAGVASIRFRLPTEFHKSLIGVLRQSHTAVGQVVIVVYGYTFHFRDLLYLMRTMFRPFALLMFSPFILPASAMAFFLVRRGLAPLRVAADKAARIDVNSLDCAIPDDDVPDEVVPFVTAVNDALKRVHQSVAAQQRFLANAAHELRTPITVLCLRIDNPNTATFTQDLKRDARRIRTLVEQLLSAAHMSHGKDAVNDIADLRKLVLSMVLDYMPLAVANDRNIELERPSEPVMIRCDRHALERVVVNLIENACRAEPQGGAVYVRVFPDATIEVVDHGSGIDAADRENIFEPFWRKDNSVPGAGLGLSITKEIVEHHGGRISVSVTPGGGATFKVSLPRIL